MKIELDGMSLNETQEEASGGIVEGRNILNFNINDKRNMISHDVPGMLGSAFQDMGRAAVKISFDGILSGKNSKSILESIRNKFKKGDPVPFNSDLSGTADITKVMIEDLRVIDNAGNKDRFNYSIVLKEYKEPPPQSTAPASLEDAAMQWADKAVDDVLALAKEEALDFVGSELGDDAKGLAGAAFDEGAKAARSELKDGMKSLF